MTFGTTQEDGIAMSPDGRSFVTSVGTVQSSVWLHDAKGERELTFEGYSTFGTIVPARSNFSADGRKLYFHPVRQQGAREFEDGELWVADLDSNRSERLLPGFTTAQFDVSADGKRVVFTVRKGRTIQIWLASLERRFPPRRISTSDSTSAGPSSVRPATFSSWPSSRVDAPSTG